jgi:SAM-dependent methyltransferase
LPPGVLGDHSRVHIVRADLEEPLLRRVYADLARLVRPGGVVCNADPMPPTGVDGLIAAMDRQADRWRPKVSEGELDWTGWWEAAATDPALAALVVERNRRFGGEIHPPDFTPPLAWHVEAGCVWRHGSAAMVAAVR